MSAPSRRMEPSSTKKSPATALKKVDLPAPLEPTMVTKSPSASVTDKPSRAFFSLTVPGLKVLETLFSSSIYFSPFRPARARRFLVWKAHHCRMEGAAMARATTKAVTSLRQSTGTTLV
jgi:hypothetical protein